MKNRRRVTDSSAFETHLAHSVSAECRICRNQRNCVYRFIEGSLISCSFLKIQRISAAQPFPLRDGFRIDLRLKKRGTRGCLVAFVIYDFTAFVTHDRASRSISIRFLSLHTRQGNHERQVYVDVSSVYIARLMFAPKYVIMLRLLQCVVAFEHL